METRTLIFLSCLLAVGILLLAGCVVLNQPRFGKLPEGERLESIVQSPNYREGEFQYPISTPLFSQDVTMLSIILSNLFDKNKRLIPSTPIPAVKTDLKGLDPHQDVVVWLGHSSWFIQLRGTRILIDPVFSDFAAPFAFFNKAFDGTNIYKADDMPEIDSLLISHDHWDHLDYSSIMALKSKVRQVICPLGIGTSIEHWGYPKGIIREGDWNDKVEIEKSVTVHLLPARHYSGRLLSKNKTLWAGFVIESSDRRIFFSGDSGYGPHFSEIGRKFNGFDLVLLDCGQYDPRWEYIHMTPEEAMQAALDLGTRAFMPAHVGRFTIANHPWDEPFKWLADKGRGKSYQIVIPKIGESVTMDNPSSQFSGWWREMEQTQVVALSTN